MNVYEKLRNAVKAALDDLEASGCDERTYDYLNEHFCNEGDCALVKLHKQLKDALDTPCRNCDVGTAGDMAQRFMLFCREHRVYTRCDGCPLLHRGAPCEFAWAQMPYEEGGTE